MPPERINVLKVQAVHCLSAPTASDIEGPTDLDWVSHRKLSKEMWMALDAELRSRVSWLGVTEVGLTRNGPARDVQLKVERRGVSRPSEQSGPLGYRVACGINPEQAVVSFKRHDREMGPQVVGDRPHQLAFDDEFPDRDLIIGAHAPDVGNGIAGARNFAKAILPMIPSSGRVSASRLSAARA
jgi:hypothetical protein